MWQRLKHRIEVSFVRFISETKKKSGLRYFLHGFLWLFSLPWMFLANLRNRFYESGWFRSYTPPISLVIGIGNITAGGTGKTPFTILLGETLAMDFSVGVSVSGYRSKAYESAYTVVVSKGEGPIQPASLCGDEARLIAERLPKIWVFAGKDRRKASQLAAKVGREILLLDDGLQHRALKKDMEVFLVNADDPFGGGYFLPRGLLRDSPKELKRARLIVISHAKSPEDYKNCIELLRPYTAAPCVGVCWGKKQIFEWEKQEPLPEGILEGKKLALFSAIAKPENFEKLIEGMGAVIEVKKNLPDHVAFQQETLYELSQMAIKRGCFALICTEKDKVKLPPLLELNLPIFWVRLDLSVVYGEENWADFLSKVRKEVYLTRPRRLLEWVEKHLA